MKLFAFKPPWYVAGLAFACRQCGRCCQGPEEGYVWVNRNETAAIAAHLGIPEPELRKLYVRKVGGRYSLNEDAGTRDCVFLVPLDGDQGGKGCKIYPVRPRQCRTWPFWPGNLHDADDWALAGVRCPGINRGPLHSRQDIEAKVDETTR